MELQPFDETDWMAFAGTEGENPLIAYSNADDGAAGFVVIADDNGIYVSWVDGPAVQYTCKRQMAELIGRDLYEPEVTPDRLICLGFERVN